MRYIACTSSSAHQACSPLTLTASLHSIEASAIRGPQQKQGLDIWLKSDRGANSSHWSKPCGETRVAWQALPLLGRGKPQRLAVETLRPCGGACRPQYAQCLNAADVLLRRPNARLSRVGASAQAAARGFDMRFGRHMAAGPHLRGRRRNTSRRKNNYRARTAGKNTGCCQQEPRVKTRLGATAPSPRQTKL